MSDLTRFNHVAIRASAGTGKTFQLTNRYIALLAAGESPDRILAVTFTRKAAGEIFERVVRRLAAAALDEDQAAELARHIGDLSLDRRRAAELLRHLIAHSHRLAVSTLDGFFVRVGLAFALELGLPPGWTIADEHVDAQLRDEAIANLLAEDESQTLVDLMRLLNKGESRRGVTDQIARVVRDLRALFGEAPQRETWTWLRPPRPLDRPELAAAVEALREYPVTTDKRMTKAKQEDVARAARQEWLEFIAKGLAGKIAAGDHNYYKRPIPEPLVECYEVLLDHARAALCTWLAGQNEASYELLRRFDAQYRRLQARQRMMRFDDITAAIAGADEMAVLDRLYYRLDAQVGHLLLDEFQDTSLAQWNVLLPLAEEIAAHSTGERSLLCVGDMKQAIYGWRGGEARIFDSLAESLHGAVETETLVKSWRSSPAVIETVNLVFSDLLQNPMMSERQEAARHWAEGFEPHDTAKKDLPGYCELRTAPAAGEEEDQQVVTQRYAAGRVAKIVEAAPALSVGVLTRRNAAVARMIYELRQLGVYASEEGGNPLTDSPAVSVVLSLLAMADHPGDTAARFHVAASPLGPEIGLTEHRDDPAARRVAATVRRELLERGYRATVTDWVRALAPHCDRRDVRRLGQLADLAAVYDPQATARPEHFAEFVRSQRVEDPASANVRVMTVHQAKGLEFDVVVLPELDYSLTGQPAAALIDRPNPVGPITRITRYAGKNLRSVLTEVEPLARQAEESAMSEALSLLYVAMTRAVHTTLMIIAPSSKTERKLPSTYAGLIRGALTDGTPLEPEQRAWSLGTPGWHRDMDKAAVEQAGPVALTPVEPRVARATRRARVLPRTRPSEMEGGDRVQLADLLRFNQGEAMSRGSVIHQWFELIGWLDEDGEPTDEQLHRAVAGMHVSASDLEAWRDEFREMLTRPNIREALSRGVFGDHAEAHCERPFMIRDGDSVLSGSFDRLVVVREGGNAARAEVIDFKTDRIDEDREGAVEERSGFYAPQIDAYRRAAAKLFALPADAVTGKLLFLEADVVRSV